MVAALYVLSDGHYSSMAGVDAWDINRDATRYAGPYPVVAHPPCGPWGRYHHKCHQDASTALTAVKQVQRYGGVLEHPADSKLWSAAGLPYPSTLPLIDIHGGYTLAVKQSRWGHPAPKPTWLYIVRPSVVPELPPPVPDPGGRIENMSKKKRKLTPLAFAHWLVQLAQGCQ